jgi:hypothetical protein
LKVRRATTRNFGAELWGHRPHTTVDSDFCRHGFPIFPPLTSPCHRASGAIDANVSISVLRIHRS